jgi:predicted O-methyltransferase YrrM
MGISAAYLAMGNKNAILTTIEGCSNIAERAKLNIKSLGLQNIQIINGSFDEILPVFLHSIDRLDLAFIDGNHKEIPTINYFEQCLLKSVNTSCFIFDDIHWSKEMENAWSYIVKHEMVTLSIDLYSMGIVFFRKELSKQHFIIRF